MLRLRGIRLMQCYRLGKTLTTTTCRQHWMAFGYQCIRVGVAGLKKWLPTKHIMARWLDIICESAAFKPIPEKLLPKGHKRQKKGPHYRFDEQTYKERNVVERFINHLKETRRLATRFEKLAAHFLAMVKLAFIKNLLSRNFSDTL